MKEDNRMKQLIYLLLITSLAQARPKEVPTLTAVSYNLWALPYQDLAKRFGKKLNKLATLFGQEPKKFKLSALDTKASKRVVNMAPKLKKLNADV